MTIHNPAGLQPPDPVTWQKVNLRLLAKALAELMHEQMIVPVITGKAEDGCCHLRINTDHAAVWYSVDAYQRHLDYWHLLPRSIQRHENDVVSSLPDVLLFFLEMQETLGVSSFTLAHYVEELLNTLYADAYIHTRGRLTAAQLAAADYQTVEHQMDGHPWVIVNKGRIGFNAEDYRQYAPEVNRDIRLLWIAVHKSRAAFRSLPGIEEQDFLLAELGAATLHSFRQILAGRQADPQAYTFMPVHPWQWNNKLLVQYAPDMANGLLLFLGEGPDQYSPQQSIRTFYNKSHPHKHYVKTAISILSTGNIRGLSPKQMAIAPRVTEWVLQQLVGDAYLQQLGLVLLGEVATVSYQHPYYHAIVDPPYQYKEFLGVLWRESAEKYLRPGERLVTMASLLYIDEEEKSFIGELISRSGLSVEAWIGAYLQAYLKPLLHIYYRHSLCVTPHGENVLLILRNDVPVRMVIKDFVDDIVLTEEAKATLPPDLAAGMITSSNKDHVPLFILLGVFDAFFRYLADVLHTYVGYHENAFWEKVYEVVLDYQSAHPDLQERFKRYNLLVPAFKRFYINRVRLLQGYEERTSFAIPPKGGTLINPLAVIGQQLSIDLVNQPTDTAI